MRMILTNWMGVGNSCAGGCAVKGIQQECGLVCYWCAGLRNAREHRRLAVYESSELIEITTGRLDTHPSSRKMAIR